jgi:hypothetical protein
VWITTFEKLGETLEWTAREDGKEYAVCDLEIWSDEGWTRVENVIRHVYAAGLIRVVTRTGVVDVTPDHSLIDSAGNMVKPCDVSVGDTLLHRDLPCFDFLGEAVTDPEEARFMGFSVRCKGTWVPSCILAASRDIRTAFCSGLFDSDTIDLQSQFDAATVTMLLSSLGIDFSLSVPVNGVYRVTALPTCTNKDTVTWRWPVLYTGTYVYDVTTANHHFAAGPGRLIVHNTDSVMVKFAVPEAKRHDLETHFEIAGRVAREISESFPGCIELEFEKCYYPYLLFSKKRYAGQMFTKIDKPDYIDVKGLQMVRRDSAPIVDKVSKAILDAIMNQKSVEKALEASRKCVLNVITGREPIENFVVSKSLRGKYVNPNAQPHVQVARKIKERTGESIGSGTRVPYVFVVDDNIDGLISSRAEDPAYVVEQGLNIDYLYYLENQLMNPITALLEVLVDDPSGEILGSPEISSIVEEMRGTRKKLVREVKRVKTNVRNKQHEITRFFSPP